MSDYDKFITVEDVAERMQKSADWVLDQVRLGKIPCTKFNSRTYMFHWPTVVKALTSPTF